MCKKLFTACVLVLLAPATVPAWDGFDAATVELVEIIPDHVPSRGENIQVRSYADDATEICRVESVIRNARTIEVAVRCSQKGKRRTLVMEGK